MPEEIGRCKEVPLCCGREPQRAGLFVNTQAENGCIHRRKGDLLLLYHLCKDRCSSACILNDLNLAPEVVFRYGMVVVDMYFYLSGAGNLLKRAESVGFFGIYEDQTGYTLKVYLPYSLDLKRFKSLEELPDLPLLRAREDGYCLMIDFFSAEHGGKTVKICINMADDQVHKDRITYPSAFFLSFLLTFILSRPLDFASNNAVSARVIRSSWV